MPSFLNKVFGYKKHDDKEPSRATRDASDSTLLDGKYETISPILSPAAATFPEALSPKDSDRDGAFSFFKSRSRGASQKPAQKRPEVAPHLTLQLPGSKGNSSSRALGAVFEADPNSQVLLDDTVIAAKRLNPSEALMLVRACARAITERGVETLGIMHPHWVSASSDVQRKLISLFIRSLTPESRKTTLPPSDSLPVSDFENELQYTRSPHDVAAVFRWGLRHLALGDGHFGKDSTEWGWYNSFFLAEHDASYPSKAFSELLLPRLPRLHVELLTATLGLISSLASHAEANGISGSKLSKCLGLWLLSASRSEEADDWSHFYARWDRAGRILEHLFLVRLREESLVQRLPTRLQELVKHYPYNKGSSAPTDILLSRPRFSTRQHDALFVRVETLLTHDVDRPKQNAVQLLLEAFQLPVDNSSEDECISLWNALKTTAFEEVISTYPDGPQFTRIFVDETIHLLSLISFNNSAPTTPGLWTSPISRVVSRKRSSSLTKVPENTIPRSNPISGSTPVSPTSPSSAVIADWTQFSLSGFGDIPATQPLSVLLDKDDVEVSRPSVSRKSSRHRGKSRTRRRRSEDREALDAPLSSQLEREPCIVETKLGSIHVVQVDEAFIDFWSDAVVDPISTSWPAFVVCGLKQLPGAEQPVRWLIIEQAYSYQQSHRTPSPDAHRGRSPRPSFRSDISGFRINTMFSSTRKRFSAFSKSVTDLDLKKSGGKNPITGELGEILVEEESTTAATVPLRADHHVNGNTAAATAVISGLVADVADQVKTDKISTAPVAAAPSADPISNSKVADEVPSVEPTPHSGAGLNNSSEVPRYPVKASEEVVSVDPGSPSTVDAVNPELSDTTSPVVEITSLSMGTPHRDSCATQEEHGAIQAEDRPVELVTPPAEFAGGPSDAVQVDVTEGPHEEAEAVVTTSARPLDTIQIAAVTPVSQHTALNSELPGSTADGLHVVEEVALKDPVDLVAAYAVESVGQQGTTDDLASASAVDVRDKIIVAAMGTQLKPDLTTTSVIDGFEEATEAAEVPEIPTPTPEPATLVEETPSPDADVVACVAETVVEDSAPQPTVATDSQMISEAKELCITQSSGVSSLVAIDAAVNTDDQTVTDGTEKLTDQVPEQETEAIMPDTVEISASGDIPADTSVGQESADVALVEAQAQTATVSLFLEAPMSTAEHAALDNEVPSLDIPAEAAVEDTPAVLQSRAPEAMTAEPEIEDIAEVIQFPTQVANVQPVEVSSATPEAVAAPSAMKDEIAVVKTGDQLMCDAAAEDPAPGSQIIQETKDVNAATEAVPTTTTTDSEVVENKATEPATEEVQVHVGHVVSTGGEPAVTTCHVVSEDPVGWDVHVPATYIKESSGESGSQSVDEATNHPIVVDSASEKDLVAVEVETQAAPEAVRLVDPTAVDESQLVIGDALSDSLVTSEAHEAAGERNVVDASGPISHVAEPEATADLVLVPVVEDVTVQEPCPDTVEVAEDITSPAGDAAPAVLIDEAGEEVDELQEQISVSANPVVTSEVDDPNTQHEAVGPSGESTPEPVET